MEMLVEEGADLDMRVNAYLGRIDDLGERTLRVTPYHPARAASTPSIARGAHLQQKLNTSMANVTAQNASPTRANKVPRRRKPPRKSDRQFHESHRGCLEL